MNKNKILKLLIIIIIVLFIVLTIFLKFRKKEGLEDIGYVGKLEDTVVIKPQLDYKSTYANEIINENNLKLEYQIFQDKSNLYGKIYIDSNHYLNITDDFRKINKKINDNKYTTIYGSILNGNKIVFYALTNSQKLYKITLNTANINDIEYYELNLNSKITNFVKLNIKVVGSSEVSPVVLCEDGNMYVADNGLLYSPDYYELYDKYIVFEDRTVTTNSGKKIITPDGKEIKLRGYIIFNERVFYNNPKIALITDNAALLFAYSDSEVFIYNKPIKSLNSENKIEITFIDDTTLKFNGVYVSILEEDK